MNQKRELLSGGSKMLEIATLTVYGTGGLHVSSITEMFVGSIGKQGLNGVAKLLGVESLL